MQAVISGTVAMVLSERDVAVQAAAAASAAFWIRWIWLLIGSIGRCYGSNPCRTRSVSCCMTKSRSNIVDCWKGCRSLWNGGHVSHPMARFRAHTVYLPPIGFAFCRASSSTRLTIVLLVMTSVVTIRPVGAKSTANGVVAQRSSVDVGQRTKAPDCRSVPHDVLWQRLNLDPTDYDDRTRFTALPVTDEHADKRGKRKGSLTGPKGIEHKKKAPPERMLSSLKESATEGEEEERRRKKKRKGTRWAQQQQQTRLRRRNSKRRNAERTRTNELWQCRMEPKWKKMDEGTFPLYVMTGRCKQTTCMNDFYVCTPRKYLIKVLKKVDAACFPVPAIAINSTYEEVWTFADYEVTVGCDCMKRPPGFYHATGIKS